MSGLVEFLLARIAEDEAIARSGDNEYRPEWDSWQHRPNERGPWLIAKDPQGRVRPMEVLRLNRDLDSSVADHICHHDPARVLAECEAKRRIVALMTDTWEQIPDGDDAREALTAVLRLLALPYAAHADYDESWRP